MANPFKLATFISQWTGRRVSDVIRAMEDGKSEELSAWYEDAVNAQNTAAQEEERRVADIAERNRDIAERNRTHHELMCRVRDRLGPLGGSFHTGMQPGLQICRNQSGPLFRKETRNAWLVEHGWTFTADNICEKNGYSRKGYDAPEIEIIFQLEEADGREEGEYQKLAEAQRNPQPIFRPDEYKFHGKKLGGIFQHADLTDSHKLALVMWAKADRYDRPENAKSLLEHFTWADLKQLYPDVGRPRGARRASKVEYLNVLLRELGLPLVKEIQAPL